MGSERERSADTSAERMVLAMRETAARLNGIIQSVMDAIITVDENQDIVIFNPAAEQMFGCSAANVQGTPLDQFIPLRYRDTHRAHVQQFAATGVTTRRMGRQAEIIGLRANGEEFPVEASISQAVVNGKKLFSVILRDVTQRKHAEEALRDSAERYQRLVELVPDAIWIERDGHIAFVNRACAQLLGADSVAQLLGKSPLQFIHPDFHRLAIARRERLLIDPQRNLYLEKRIVTLNAELKDVEIAETSFHDEGGIAILAVLRDITKRKAAEHELRESREQLRRLSGALQAAREEEQARIARELHDELGQALTALKMDVAVIINEVPAEQASTLNRAKEMARMLEGTVASVRRIATQLRPLMLDDLGLLPTIGWMTKDFSKRTGIEVEQSLPDPDTQIDAQLSTVFFRVLQESLTNVAKHSGATRMKIVLACSDANVRLHVSDNGQGFDTSAVRGGHTFGLLGMRERAGMMGGTLTIDGKPGTGTSIEMVIPLEPRKPA